MRICANIYEMKGVNHHTVCLTLKTICNNSIEAVVMLHIRVCMARVYKKSENLSMYTRIESLCMFLFFFFICLQHKYVSNSQGSKEIIFCIDVVVVSSVAVIVVVAVVVAFTSILFIEFESKFLWLYNNRCCCFHFYITCCSCCLFVFFLLLYSYFRTRF